MEASLHIDTIVKSLQRDRDEHYAKVKEIDNIIKKLKSGDVSFLLNNSTNSAANDLAAKSEPINNDEAVQPLEFPVKAEVKVQILRILDIIGKACKLKDIQDQYKKLTGTNPNLRESVRTLNKLGRVLLMKERDASRGNYWVRFEWVENGRLLDQYKFEGFDLLYKDENLDYIQNGQE